MSLYNFSLFNPFLQHIKVLEGINTDCYFFCLLSFQQYVDALENSLTSVNQYTQQVTALVDCTGIHKDYISALHGVCYDTM